MVDQDVSGDLDAGYTWWQSASLNRIRNANSDQLDIANGLDTVITVDLADVSMGSFPKGGGDSCLQCLHVGDQRFTKYTVRRVHIFFFLNTHKQEFNPVSPSRSNMMRLFSFYASSNASHYQSTMTS